MAETAEKLSPEQIKELVRRDLQNCINFLNMVRNDTVLMDIVEEYIVERINVKEENKEIQEEQSDPSQLNMF